MSSPSLQRIWSGAQLLGVALGVLGAIKLLGYGCTRWVETSRRTASAAAAAPYLEPANALRRRVGLMPVSPALPLRSYYAYSIVHLMRELGDAPRRFHPYLASKDLLYSPTSRRLRSERETIVLASSADGKEWLLEREFFFAAPTSRLAWRIMSTDINGNRRYLTLAQADSTLAYWKAQGARDSLAAVSKR